MLKIVKGTAMVFVFAPFFVLALRAASADLVSEGKALFKKQCAVCHGSEGKGDGPAADFLFPKPRNLASKLFKLRSTPTGELPTDEDLVRTIARGMPGSAMPSFSFLSEGERKALVAYVKELAGIDEKPGKVIRVPPELAATSQTMAQGKAVYEKMGCAACHGPKGKGDGPSAATLLDSWDFPNPPNDFTRGIYKGGGSPSDLYLRFTTGMDGSPMPSFEESLTDTERWALVHYLKSLAGPKVAVQPSAGAIAAMEISGPLPKDPLDPLWNKVSETVIPLMRLWQGKKAVDEVLGKAIHNGKEIAFLLEWEDGEVNASFLRHQDFTDSAAIMFSLSPKQPLPEQPHFTMGEKGGPVNIWYWRFDRQLDLDSFQDIERVYPAMVADDYQLERTLYPKSTEKPGHLPITSAPSHDPVFLAGWGAGNILSVPQRPAAVEDLNAEGFGTLAAQPQEDQNVQGHGIYVAGKWKVLFTRGLRSEGGSDAQFERGGKFPIAFAVWDGSKGDRDGQKAVTPWYLLKL
ncbi:MAG: c-type cytochrome [Elusimicrobia bacterium]|nr:c-type cytochrome [Elusimicrobiota bacterium]